MKIINILLQVIALIGLMGCQVGLNASAQPKAQPKIEVAKPNYTVAQTEVELSGSGRIQLPSIADFTKQLMEDCASGSKLSEAMTKIQLNQIVRAVETNLVGLEQYAYVSLLCMETRVGKLNKPKSHAGAIGISQLIPSTAQAEAKRCGYGEIKVPDDLYDNELNLLISTCHFKKLVEDHGLAWAPLAYNAGGAAESVAKAKRLVPPSNLETAGYGAIQGVILTRYLLEPLGNQALTGHTTRKKTVAAVTPTSPTTANEEVITTTPVSSSPE